MVARSWPAPAPETLVPGPPAVPGASGLDPGVSAGDVVPDVLATTRQGVVWMGFAVAGFLVGQVASAVLLLLTAAFTGHLRDVSQLATRTIPPAWVVVSGLVGLWFGFVGAVVLASRAQGTGNVWRDMRVRFEPSDALLGPAIGLGGQFILLPLLYLPLEHVVPRLSQRLSEPAKHLTGGFPGADLAVIAVLTVLVVPVVEELVFRGLFLRGALRAFSGLGRLVGPTVAIVTTGVVFALAHLELLQMLGLAAFGVVLSVMAYRLGRLGPCILAHATFNLVAVVSVATVGVAR
ncbi:MAG TPA: CPBP family intramembrane glutamic endopeptidase [Acidimicrobiales bacterium]|nr:CPBP family intramembrane glutamic endopeptidase [Acidimicrobiales bacterium]